MLRDARVDVSYSCISSAAPLPPAPRISRCIVCIVCPCPGPRADRLPPPALRAERSGPARAPEETPAADLAEVTERAPTQTADFCNIRWALHRWRRRQRDSRRGDGLRLGQAKELLGVTLRPVEKTVYDCIESAVELGLITPTLWRRPKL